MQPAFAQISQTWDVKARDRAEALNSAGIALLNKRKLSQAVDKFTRATAADPKDPLSFQLLGLALTMEGKYAEALDSLQKSYSLRASTETLLSTGIVYYLQHDYDAAINAFDKILQANPRLTHVYGDLGMALMRKGNLPQAEEYFERLVRSYPNSQLGYQGLAQVRCLEGKLTSAYSAAERAQMIQPYPPVLLVMANIDLVQGNRSRARKRAGQFTSAWHRRFQPRSMTELGYPMQHDFHFDPYLQDSLDNGALLLAGFEDNAYRKRDLAGQAHARRTVAALERELGRAPGDLLLTHQLGLAQLALGDYSSAAEAFKSVVERSGTWAIDRLYLARALALDGRAEQGSSAVREFAQDHPSEELAPAFTQVSKVDPALQHEQQVQKQLPRLERPGPKPVPASQF